MKTALVYVLILAWNRRDDTLECITSLLNSSYQQLQVVVCDNGSTDDTVSAVSTNFPDVKLLEFGRNLGFAAGANRGLRFALDAGAQQILLINNDVVVDPTMVEHLVAAIAPQVGIIAPMIYYADAPSIIWSAGGMRSRWTLEQIGDRRGQHDSGNWPPRVRRDFVSGCAMLLTRTLLETVGLFDERFFMYYEDNDFCLRARKAGFEILLVPTARMWHKVSASSGGADSPQERFQMAKSSVLFYRKHIHGWRWFLVAPFRLGSAVKTTIRLLKHHRTNAIVTYWKGLYEGLCGE